MSVKRLCQVTGSLLLLGGLGASLLAQPVVAPPGTGITPPPPLTTAAPAVLALPKPAKPYPMEPGLRVSTKAGQPPIVGAYLYRAPAGAFRLYLKFASGNQRWLTYATSNDGKVFQPSNQWLNNVPFLAGPGLGLSMVNVTDGSVAAAYTVPATQGNQIDMAISKDGNTWTVVRTPALAGTGAATDGGPTDPCVLILPTGLVMYYVRTLNGVPHVFSAVSKDGYDWTAVPASVLTNAPQMGLKTLANPAVTQVGPQAYFMTFAATDAAGKQFLGMAVSTDGSDFQYLGSLDQILDLSAYTAVTNPQMNLTAEGSLRLLCVVQKADGSGGVASATLPPPAVTCVPSTATSP
jgi:hypothetical protein